MINFSWTFLITKQSLFEADVLILSGYVHYFTFYITSYLNLIWVKFYSLYDFYLSSLDQSRSGLAFIFSAIYNIASIYLYIGCSIYWRSGLIPPSLCKSLVLVHSISYFHENELNVTTRFFDSNFCCCDFEIISN